METKNESAEDPAQPRGEMSENVRQCPTEKNSLNEPPTDSLTHHQLVAIDLLAQGTPIHAIARKLEIDARTLYRWRHQPVFAQVLAGRRAELWSDVSQRLRGMAHSRLNVLDEELRSNYDRARVRAATTLLKLLDLRKTTADLDEDPGPPPHDY